MLFDLFIHIYLVSHPCISLIPTIFLNRISLFDHYIDLPCIDLHRGVLLLLVIDSDELEDSEHELWYLLVGAVWARSRFNWKQNHKDKIDINNLQIEKEVLKQTYKFHSVNKMINKEPGLMHVLINCFLLRVWYKKKIYTFLITPEWILQWMVSIIKFAQ